MDAACKNIGAKKISPWYRATYFRNKAQKGKTTVWVHKEYARKYYAENETEPISVSERDGVRKYSPASYIKKYMKGYFDIAILMSAMCVRTETVPREMQCTA